MILLPLVPSNLPNSDANNYIVSSTDETEKLASLNCLVLFSCYENKMTRVQSVKTKGHFLPMTTGLIRKNVGGGEGRQLRKKVLKNTGLHPFNEISLNHMLDSNTVMTHC